MQTMFRLPWSSEPPGDKIMEKAAFHKASRPMPVVDIPFMNKLKRKRTDSPEMESHDHSHVLKRWKDANGEVKSVVEKSVADPVTVANGVAFTPVPSQDSQELPTQTSNGSNAAPGVKLELPQKESAPKPSQAQPEAQNPAPKPDAASNSAPTPAMEKDVTRAQQVIEAQFNYEILLKHNELRLIEQELAKCQVALEQLRRCSLIPFPGSQGPSQNVSGGVGPALQPTPGYTEPQYAAPWGVTDGPYTRHYAKWLIPDPKFDSIPERELAQAQSYFGLGLGEGRLTRGSFAEYPSTSKARTSRTSTGTLKLQALGENPAPAPKIDPLLHKRSTDGQWVRLYCAQCGHSNFSNTQGFLNHCRIKHNQVFKSHDAAAIACGVPVDVNEGGNPVQAAEPPSATTVSTPTVSFPAPITPGFVHPLIRANAPQPAKDVYRDFSVKTARDNAPSPLQPGFAPSPSTPYMTALFQRRGFSGDLKQIVDAARTSLDVCMDASDDDTTDSSLPTPTAHHSKATASQTLARLPASGPNGGAVSKATAMGRSTSQKGHQSMNQPRMQRIAVPPPVQINSSMSGMMTDTPHHVPASPIDLSPHTVESNPGLVSDHDDDEDDDADDAHSEPRIEHGDSGFVMSDDVVVEDASDVEGAERRARSRKAFGGCFDKGEASQKK